jgi:hypothetical protein
MFIVSPGQCESNEIGGCVARGLLIEVYRVVYHVRGHDAGVPAQTMLLVSHIKRGWCCTRVLRTDGVWTVMSQHCLARRPTKMILQFAVANHFSFAIHST